MNRRGIVILPAWYPNSLDPVSGIFVRQQAGALQAAGSKISVFFVEEQRHLWKNILPGVRYALEDDVSTFRLRTFVPPKRIKPLRIYWLRQWDRLMRAYVDHYDRYPEILHAHSFVGGAAARYLSEKYDIPYVLTEHYSGFIRGEIPSHWEKDLSEIYEHASKVIAVSPALAKGMSAYVSHLEVIPNMVDTHLFWPDEPTPDNAEIKRIISIGSLIPRKNHEILLRIFAQIGENFPLELTIIGGGPLRGKLEQLAHKLGVASRVNFTGVISPPEVAAHLRSAHLYVSTSRSESFALAPVEALACGLPVVMMKCGSMLESIYFDEVLLTEERSQLKAGILRQLKRPDRINRLALHRQVKAVFAPEVIARQLQAVYAGIPGPS